MADADRKFGVLYLVGSGLGGLLAGASLTVAGLEMDDRLRTPEERESAKRARAAQNAASTTTTTAKK
jgi:hypothetical protein